MRASEEPLVRGVIEGQQKVAVWDEIPRRKSCQAGVVTMCPRQN